MKNSSGRRWILLLNFVALSVLSAPAGLIIDTAKSRVTASFTQMNVPVEAVFTQVSGFINFDAVHPEKASTSIEVATSSFDLGDADYNAEARKPEWLASGSYPKASFVSSAIKPLGDDNYLATGTLLLKGRSIAVQVPVRIGHPAAAISFDGSLQISRKAFAIGDASWNEVLADPVTIKFHIVQAR